MTREIDTWRDTTHLRRSSTAEITSRAGYHLADFSLIALTTHTLTGQWLHDLFLKLLYFPACMDYLSQNHWAFRKPWKILLVRVLFLCHSLRWPVLKLPFPTRWIN